MFPANEFLIAAEDAYRRERMIAVRPPRRTRRSHEARRPAGSRRGVLQRLASTRTTVAGPDGDCLHVA